MKFSGTKSNPISQTHCNGTLTIFHTRRDFSKKDITVTEIGIAFFNISNKPNLVRFNFSRDFIN